MSHGDVEGVVVALPFLPSAVHDDGADEQESVDPCTVLVVAVGQDTSFDRDGTLEGCVPHTEPPSTAHKDALF